MVTVFDVRYGFRTWFNRGVLEIQKSEIGSPERYGFMVTWYHGTMFALGGFSSMEIK